MSPVFTVGGAVRLPKAIAYSFPFFEKDASAVPRRTTLREALVISAYGT